MIMTGVTQLGRAAIPRNLMVLRCTRRVATVRNHMVLRCKRRVATVRNLMVLRCKRRAATVRNHMVLGCKQRAAPVLNLMVLRCKRRAATTMAVPSHMRLPDSPLVTSMVIPSSSRGTLSHSSTHSPIPAQVTAPVVAIGTVHMTQNRSLVIKTARTTNTSTFMETGTMLHPHKHRVPTMGTQTMTVHNQANLSTVLRVSLHPVFQIMNQAKPPTTSLPVSHCHLWSSQTHVPMETSGTLQMGMISICTTSVCGATSSHVHARHHIFGFNP